MKSKNGLGALFVICLGMASVSQAEPAVNRAILLNNLIGEQPQTIRLLIVEGPAQGCQAQGRAVLNKKRLRYEYNLEPIVCAPQGLPIHVGQVVRGQHNILGTMANSGMGRKVFSTNKGVTVTLTTQ